MSEASKWGARTRLYHAIGGTILILLALAMFPLFWEKPYRKFQARNWPMARGVVTAAKREDTAALIGPLIYGPQVQLRFFFNTGGARFDATQVILLKDAEAMGVRPPPGILETHQQPPVRVTCYYNPSDPRQAVITRGFDRSDLIVLTPLVLVGLGVGLIVRGRRIGRESADPVGRLKHRNQNEWDVEPTPQGIRCVPNNRANKLTLSRITEMVRGEAFDALELLDYPLRRDRPNRLRIHRPPGGERRKLVIHLEAIEPGRSFVGLRGASRSEQIVVANGDEDPAHLFEFEVPGDEFVKDGCDLRLRVTPEAGIMNVTPRFLWVEIEGER